MSAEIVKNSEETKPAEAPKRISPKLSSRKKAAVAFSLITGGGLLLGGDVNDNRKPDLPSSGGALATQYFPHEKSDKALATPVSTQERLSVSVDVLSTPTSLPTATTEPTPVPTKSYDELLSEHLGYFGIGLIEIS